MLQSQFNVTVVSLGPIRSKNRLSRAFDSITLSGQVIVSSVTIFSILVSSVTVYSIFCFCLSHIT